MAQLVMKDECQVIVVKEQGQKIQGMGHVAVGYLEIHLVPIKYQAMGY